MAVYAITFSPVGGTRKAAGFFLKGFCSDGIPIDLTDRALAFSDMAFTARDICLVAVPAYGGRVPRPAAERLGQMHGGGARAILMAVYGNRAFEDTLAELAGLLCAAGFRCTAGVAAVAQHSIFPQFAAKRPDAADAAQLAAFARQVRAALDGGAVPQPVLPGARARGGRRRPPPVGPGHPTLPPAGRHGPEAPRRRGLHRLRPVCQPLPRGGHSPAGARANRCIPLHWLHALCRRLPGPCTPRGCSGPGRGTAKAAKGLRGPQAE